jgi:CDP-diacylglycerol--glycerol-3-phosphate 3-phosphatidyltransferase
VPWSKFNAHAWSRFVAQQQENDRAFVFGLAGLLVGLGVAIEAPLNWFWAAVAAFLCFTIANRVRRGIADAPLVDP